MKTLRNGFYLDEQFDERLRDGPWTLKDRALVLVVYVGMLCSLALFAAGLLGLVWVAGIGARALARWMGG